MTKRLKLKGPKKIYATIDPKTYSIQDIYMRYGDAQFAAQFDGLKIIKIPFVTPERHQLTIK